LTPDNRRPVTGLEDAAAGGASPDGLAASDRNSGCLIRTLAHVCAFGRIERLYSMLNKLLSY